MEYETPLPEIGLPISLKDIYICVLGPQMAQWATFGHKRPNRESVSRAMSQNGASYECSSVSPFSMHMFVFQKPGS